LGWFGGMVVVDAERSHQGFEVPVHQDGLTKLMARGAEQQANFYFLWATKPKWIQTENRSWIRHRLAEGLAVKGLYLIIALRQNRAPFSLKLSNFDFPVQQPNASQTELMSQVLTPCDRFSRFPRCTQRQS
jgi:hypothetical protein